MIDYLNNTVKRQTIASLPRHHHTAWTEAKQFAQVRTDAKTGALLDLLHQDLDPTVVEALHLPAVCADKVVTVSLAQAVAVALVQPVDALEQVEITEQPHRAEDTGDPW